MKLVPLHNNILLEPPVEEKEKKTQSGIIMPDSHDEKKETRISKVVAVGPLVQSFKPGDTVLWYEYGLDEVVFEGKRFFIGSGEHVIAKIG